MGVAIFLAYWLLTGLIWGGLCHLMTRRRILAGSPMQDAVGGLIGYGVCFLLFGGQPAGFWLFALVIVVTTAMLSQNWLNGRIRS